MGRNFSVNHLPVGLDGDVAAGTDGARVDLAEIDCRDCQSVTIIALPTTIAASGVLTLYAKGSDTSASYGAGTIGDLGSVANPVAGEGDNLPLVLEIHNPTQRYIKPQYQRTGGNVTLQSVIVIKRLRRDVRSTEVSARTILNAPEASTT